MKITYVSHAALLIEVGGIKILTDPWLKGSAYCDQWFLFPRPSVERTFSDVDFVLYSHGHEDHLHPDSLSLINPKTKIFYPYSWYGGAKEFFEQMGFQNLTEAINEKTYTLCEDTRVTYFSNNMDNVIVIEYKNKVIVNVNDALPSAPHAIINNIVDKIKKRWPKPDYVFSSYGGAAYFPNCVRFKDKNDMEIGKTRELFFLNNFCDFVQKLSPKYAVPFASDFVLLDDDQQWINETKFPRNKIKEYYKERTKNSTNVEILELYADDYIDDNKVVKCSAHHKKNNNTELAQLVKEEYAGEIERKRNLPKITDAEATIIFEKLRKHVAKKLYVIPEIKRKEIKYAIRLSDYSKSTYFNIDLRGNEPNVYRTDVFENDAILLMELRSKTLLYSMQEEWGGDAIIIGYGCLLTIYDIRTIEKDLHNLCVRLITNYPNTKEYLKKTPFRAMKYLMTDSLKRNSLLGNFLPGERKKIKFSDPLLGDHLLWLSKSKCEICKACNLPELY
ncbi:MAG: MBL fold metallo-hydrolase [Bacteroidia bacterium]